MEKNMEVQHITSRILSEFNDIEKELLHRPDVKVYMNAYTAGLFSDISIVPQKVKRNQYYIGTLCGLDTYVDKSNTDLKYNVYIEYTDNKGKTIQKQINLD